MMRALFARDLESPMEVNSIIYVNCIYGCHNLSKLSNSLTTFIPYLTKFSERAAVRTE